jgi:hypothetical protein
MITIKINIYMKYIQRYDLYLFNKIICLMNKQNSNTQVQIFTSRKNINGNILENITFNAAQWNLIG